MKVIKTQVQAQILFLALLLPNNVYAHGEEVILTLFWDLLIILVLIGIILLLNWKAVGKLLLIGSLLLSEFITYYLLIDIPYNANEQWINAATMFVPITTASLLFLVLRRRFVKSK